MAICCLHGRGCPKNLAEAVRYAKIGADKGDPECQNTYGIFLESGRGVEKNLQEALRYYKMSMESGNETGKMCYDQLKKQLDS